VRLETERRIVFWSFQLAWQEVCGESDSLFSPQKAS